MLFSMRDYMRFSHHSMYQFKIPIKIWLTRHVNIQCCTIVNLFICFNNDWLRNITYIYNNTNSLKIKNLCDIGCDIGPTYFAQPIDLQRKKS